MRAGARAMLGWACRADSAHAWAAGDGILGLGGALGCAAPRPPGWWGPPVGPTGHVGRRSGIAGAGMTGGFLLTRGLWPVDFWGYESSAAGCAAASGVVGPTASAGGIGHSRVWPAAGGLLPRDSGRPPPPVGGAGHGPHGALCGAHSCGIYRALLGRACQCGLFHIGIRGCCLPFVGFPGAVCQPAFSCLAELPRQCLAVPLRAVVRALGSGTVGMGIRALRGCGRVGT